MYLLKSCSDQLFYAILLRYIFSAMPEHLPCPTHCYRSAEHETARTIVRYSGLKMLTRRPALTIEHLSRKYFGTRARPVRSNWKGAVRHMKRHKLLKPLTDDHHHALVLSVRLRKTAKNDPLTAEAMFREKWNSELQPHFRMEDDILLPEIALASSEAKQEIVQTCTDHIALRSLARQIERASPAEKSSLLLQFAKRLEEHVRFEERTLFPLAESLLKEDGLLRLKLTSCILLLLLSLNFINVSGRSLGYPELCTNQGQKSLLG